jgi:hypothetical protein
MKPTPKTRTAKQQAKIGSSESLMKQEYFGCFGIRKIRG